MQKEDPMNEYIELLYVTGILEEDSNEISDYNYIRKGIRIQTLAREKQQHLFKESKNRTVRFFDLDVRTLNYNSDIANKQIKSAIKRKIRKLCSQIKSDEQLENVILPIFHDLTTNLNDITVSICKDNTFTLPKIVSGGNQILIIKIYDQIYYSPLNPKKSFKNTGYYYKSFANLSANMFHIEDFYLYLYVINKLNHILKTHGEDLINNNSGHNLSFLQEIMGLYENWSRKTIPEWVLQVLNPYINMNKNANTDELKIDEHIKDEALYDWADSYNYVIDYVYANKSIDSSVFLPDLYANSHLDNILSFGIYVLTFLFKNSQELYESHKQYKRCSHTATVYQTKKNIPKKIMREMRSSPLNDYFGYVEFDESIDLDSVRSITEEFILLNKDVFANLKYTDKIIRFRKLGRHRASGLYYKYLGTLAVDIRCPDSTIHEQFHMIDDLMGDLSSQIAFYDIADRYQSVLLKKIKEDEAKGIKHFSKSGKYNLKYYLKKCEIFARCGEIYLFRILKVKSSLLKQDSSVLFAYPDDSILNKMIASYYGELITKIKVMQSIKKEEKSEEHIFVADK